MDPYTKKAAMYASLIARAVEVSQNILDQKAETSCHKVDIANAALEPWNISIHEIDSHDEERCVDDVISMTLNSSVDIGIETYLGTIDIQWCPMLTEDMYTPLEIFMPQESAELMFGIETGGERDRVRIMNALTAPNRGTDKFEPDTRKHVDSTIEDVLKSSPIEFSESELTSIKKAIYVHIL